MAPTSNVAGPSPGTARGHRVVDRRAFVTGARHRPRLVAHTNVRLAVALPGVFLFALVVLVVAGASFGEAMGSALGRGVFPLALAFVLYTEERPWASRVSLACGVALLAHDVVSTATTVDSAVLAAALLPFIFGWGITAILLIQVQRRERETRLVSRLAATTRGTVTPGDVRSATLDIHWAGYDPVEVDRYLDGCAAALEAAGAGRPPGATGSDPGPTLEYVSSARFRQRVLGYRRREVDTLLEAVDRTLAELTGTDRAA